MQRRDLDAAAPSTVLPWQDSNPRPHTSNPERETLGKDGLVWSVDRRQPIVFLYFYLIVCH